MASESEESDLADFEPISGQERARGLSLLEVKEETGLSLNRYEKMTSHCRIKW
jgi:hypothetical protein